jgi:hypothetical protein
MLINLGTKGSAKKRDGFQPPAKPGIYKAKITFVKATPWIKKSLPEIEWISINVAVNRDLNGNPATGSASTVIANIPVHMEAVAAKNNVIAGEHQYAWRELFGAISEATANRILGMDQENGGPDEANSKNTEMEFNLESLKGEEVWVDISLRAKRDYVNKEGQTVTGQGNEGVIECFLTQAQIAEKIQAAGPQDGALESQLEGGSNDNPDVNLF